MIVVPGPHPDIASVKERIMSLEPVYASMSGSGASVYGLFGRDILSPSVPALFPGCDTLIASL